MSAAAVSSTSPELASTQILHAGFSIAFSSSSSVLNVGPIPVIVSSGIPRQALANLAMLPTSALRLRLLGLPELRVVRNPDPRRHCGL